MESATPLNMSVASVSALTFHEPMSRLNDVAPENIHRISVTADVSQPLVSGLDVAPENIDRISVTADVSQPLVSGLAE